MVSGQSLTIGRLAELTESNVPTIRYYEEIGLLPKARRKAGGHRTYDDGDLKRMLFIRRCREFGFPIDQVRSLIALTEETGRSCMEARDLAQAHLDMVRGKLHELEELEKSLVAFVQSCDSECAGGPPSRCTILEDLSSRPVAAKKCCPN